MIAEFASALSVLGASSALLLYALLIGFGVRAALARAVQLPLGLGLIAGTGLSLTALLMVFSHVALGRVSLPVVPLAILAAVAIALDLHHRRSVARASVPAERPVETTPGLGPRNALHREAVAVLLTLLLMLPVLQFGLTAWTLGTNDFPSYAASAEIWLGSPSAFREQHPDAFGKLQLDRQAYEKPIATAMLALLSQVSGQPPYRLLAPLLAVLMFIAVSSLLLVMVRRFRIGLPAAALALVLPTFSVVPLSRLYDAQPGQVASLALLACLLAVLTTADARRDNVARLQFALLAGVVGAAALGTNFTLVVGSSIMLCALVVWLLASDWLSLRQKLPAVLLGAVAAAVLSAPMAGMYLRSFQRQTSGDPGFDIALADPLSLIGQQISLVHVAPQSQVLLTWIVVILAIAAGLAARPAGRFANTLALVVLAAAVVNVALIGVRLGWNNYATHKWFALFIALAMPLAIAALISLLRDRSRAALMALMVPLALSSVAWGGVRLGYSIDYVISPDLIALRQSEELAALPALNIRLGGAHENSVAALVVPTDRVIVTGRTYAAASPPEAELTLVRRDALGDQDENVVVLNQTYALVPAFAGWAGAPIAFNAQSPASLTMLHGAWHDAEAWGTWSGRGDNHVRFMLPETLRGRDLVLTVSGSAYTPDGRRQAVQFLVEDELLLERDFPGQADAPLEIALPARLTAAPDGRLTLTIRTTGTYTPADFGSGDRRNLGFGLRRLALSPA